MSNIVDENEFDHMQLNVASKRKEYPQICVKLLYDTLKTEISAMQSAVVEISDNENTSKNELQQNSERYREEMKMAVDAVKSMGILNKADLVLESLANMECVLKEIVDSSNCEGEVLIKKYQTNRPEINET